MRGGYKCNAAQGGWSIFVDGDVDPSPLDGLAKAKRADGDDKENESHTVEKEEQDPEERVRKRRKLVAEGRFGTSGKTDDNKGIERLDIRIEDPYVGVLESPSSVIKAATVIEESLEAVSSTKTRRGRSAASPSSDTSELSDSVSWRPEILLKFNGSHVFAGIRKLVEEGVVDGERMPGWLTGEAGVSIGVVREGRVMGSHGSGL
jgi:central kinetochore subunit Mis15/CHL4